MKEFRPFLLVFLLLFVVIRQGGSQLDVVSGERKIFVVYETLEGKPLGASVAVEQLRADGYQVRFIDVDTQSAEMQIAIEPAREAGLPAIVVAIGGKVKAATHFSYEAPAEEIKKEALR